LGAQEIQTALWCRSIWKSSNLEYWEGYCLYDSLCMLCSFSPDTKPTTGL